MDKKNSRWLLEDNYWKESINLDVDRTYLETIRSSREGYKQ
jgi:hypothetical protein